MHVLARALQERTVWHEAMSRSVFQANEESQERRVLEWVCA